MKLHNVLMETIKHTLKPGDKVDVGTINLIIHHFVAGYQKVMLMKKGKKKNDCGMYLCSVCKELFYEPFTSPCGHSVCKTCIRYLSSDRAKCSVCDRKYTFTTIKYNIPLSSLFIKWFPKQSKGRKLTIEGNELLKSSNFWEAITSYTEALKYVPCSPTAYFHRAKANFKLNYTADALYDCKKATSFANLVEGHFLKAEIEEKLNLPESFISYIKCLGLGYSQTVVRSKLQKIIVKALITAGIPYHSSLTQILDSNNDSENAVNVSGQSSLKRRFKDDEKKVKSKVPKFETDNNVHSDKTLQNGENEILNPLIGNYEQLDSKSKQTKLKDYISSPYNLDDSDNTQVKENKNILPKVCDGNNITYKQSLPSDIINSINLNPMMSMSSKLEKAITNTIDTDIEKTIHSINQSKINDSLMNEISLLFEDGESGNERNDLVLDHSLIEVTDFECILCMRLFLHPSCTACGHVFCRECLERALDHNKHCPLCKQDIKHENSDDNREIAIDVTMQTIIQTFLPDLYKERLQLEDQEIETQKSNFPVFVCTAAFPSITCPLHIFEPKYLLMIRRAMQHHDNQFGMCLPSNDKPFHEIGTMLHIRDIKYFPDGRSVVDSIGTKRFKVKEYSLLDGYNTCEYTLITDRPITDPKDIVKIEKLYNVVYVRAKEWYDSLETAVKHQINHHYGTFPEKIGSVHGENGPDWHWWVLAVLPVENKVKVTVLGKGTLKERLLIIHRVLTCLKRRSNQTAPAVPIPPQ